MIQPAMVVIASTVRQIVTDPTAKDAAKISTSVKTVIAYLATATKQDLKIKRELLAFYSSFRLYLVQTVG